MWHGGSKEGSRLCRLQSLCKPKLTIHYFSHCCDEMPDKCDGKKESVSFGPQCKKGDSTSCRTMENISVTAEP